MQFTSIPFLIFLIVLFFVYYFPLKERTKAQNWLLLLASYIFYGIASWKMIPVLLTITIIFYFIGIAISKTKNEDTATLFKNIGIYAGIAILLYFKYLNFIIDSFLSLFKALGFNTTQGTLSIIMPLGISYFTFKLISYILEVYHGKMDPCNDFIAFATYVAFFPTIMAGPIDRPTTFIPQLKNRRSFDYEGTVEGLKRVLWGVFMKVCIADRLAIYINSVYGNISQHNGTTLALVVLLYPFQMYADFSGYSDMAIGVSKVLGFNVIENFKRPFFATNVADFWRRWHISLTSWVTDYVFMPLNIRYRSLGKVGIILAIIINMVVVGLWHGANWTYGVFGIYQGLLFIPLVLSGSLIKNSKQEILKNELPKLVDYGKMIGVFLLMSVGMMFFRATNLYEAFNIAGKILSNHGSLFADKSVFFYIIWSLPILLLRDFKNEYKLQYNFLHSKYAFIRYASIIVLSIYILFMGVFDGGQFIYFQF